MASRPQNCSFATIRRLLLPSCHLSLLVVRGLVQAPGMALEFWAHWGCANDTLSSLTTCR
jgi:hypothetical protein